MTGDEVYGADPWLRAELEGRGAGYVLAIWSLHWRQLGSAVVNTFG